MTPTTETTQQPPASGFHRRSFLQSLGLAAGAAAFPAILTGLTRRADADATSDIAILNFALNFEYLEAEYYTRGTTGLGISDFQIPTSGKGTEGEPILKSNPKVNFTNPLIAGYALEVAEDERLHVVYVRSVIESLGGTPIARPSTDYLNSFFTVGAKAEIDDAFDPFASQENFLLGGLTFSDVTVTALKGAAGLLTLPAVKSGAAGVLGTEGYHAGLLRYYIYALGELTRTAYGKISNLRDSLDSKADLDQNVVNGDGTANIVPADANSIAFGRTPRQVLNIVYGKKRASKGLFFPNGVNA